MIQYLISPDAARDLDEISEYYAAHSIEAGEKLLDEFEAKCKYLVNFPKIGKSYQLLRRDPLSDFRQPSQSHRGFSPQLENLNIKYFRN